MFTNIQLAPPNAILGVAQDCRNDSDPLKIDLTVGAYRDESGKPVVLNCVRHAEEAIATARCDHEYLPQDGLPQFVKVCRELMFGDKCNALLERICTIQAVSGTGAVRLAADFLGSQFPGKQCAIPNPTWGNHNTILDAAHVPFTTYRYIDSSGCAINMPGLLEDLSACPENSVVLFHSCGHNPTGVDPSEDQWRQILEVVLARQLLCLFDNAYQGFVSGCPDTDAWAVRLFVASGVEMMIACSFSKNFGLYGERVGALHFVTRGPSGDPAVLACIMSQLRVLARSLYSTCPAHGARIVTHVLSDEATRAQWVSECRAMADRLHTTRLALCVALQQRGVPGQWARVAAQRGMFSYTGLLPCHVTQLRERHHIYMLSSGRISLSGLNHGNMAQFVEAVAVTLGCSSSTSDR